MEEEIITYDGFEDAFLGVVRRADMPPTAAYDYNRCVGILMERDGMDRQEAVEFFEFNTVGAWVGDNTPVFVESPDGNYIR